MTPLATKNNSLKKIKIQLLLFVIIPYVIVFTFPFNILKIDKANKSINKTLYQIYPRLVNQIMKNNKINILYFCFCFIIYSSIAYSYFNN